MQRLKHRLDSFSTHFWQDRDEIASGSEWLKAVEEGIQSCDEVILVISDDSICSKVVEQEIALAREHQKTINPYFVGKISFSIPEFLAPLHIEELIEHDDIFSFTKLLRSEYDGSNRSAKVCLSQRVFPAFDNPSSVEYKDLLNRLLPVSIEMQRTSSAGSIANLNYGLIMCLIGRWDEGLQALKRYACKNNRPVSWYFFLVHLGRGKSLIHVTKSSRSDAILAYENLRQDDSHPFSNFMCALAEVAILNHGEPTIARRLKNSDIRELLRCDERAELQRLVWMTSRTWPLLTSKFQELKTGFTEVVR